MFVIPAEAGIQKVNSPGFPLPAFAGTSHTGMTETYESLTPLD